MSKYKGTIEFKSKTSLFVFKIIRGLVRISLVCAILSGLTYMGLFRDVHDRVTHPDATPTIALFAIWLLLKVVVNLRIGKSMANEAKSRGLTLRQYKAETFKKKRSTSFEVAREVIDLETERGQDLRAKEALRVHWSTLDMKIKTVPRIWRRDNVRGKEARKEALGKAFRDLKAAQEQGQAIVDKTSRLYAIREYGALNGNLLSHQVEEILRKENGEGPVTWAVSKLYDSVHYEYKAYFEDKFDTTRTFSIANNGYHEVQGVDGSKKRVYHTDW